MTVNPLLVQAIGFGGTILFFLSYQCKRNKNLFRVQLVSYLCYTVHLLLLGAVTGGISYMLNTLRSFCLGSRSAFLKGKMMCYCICILQVITLFLTGEGWWSILPVAANIAATISGYTGNPRKIRVVGIFINSPMWIVYSVLVDSWAGVLDEIVTEASMLLSIWRYGWKNLDVIDN